MGHVVCPLRQASSLLWTWTFSVGRTNVALRWTRLLAAPYRLIRSTDCPHPSTYLPSSRTLLLLLKLWVWPTLP